MPFDLHSAEQLVAAIGRGEKNAETLLIEQHYRVVLYILKKRVQDEELARDLCQEAFRVTLERLRKQPLAEPDKLAAFIHSVAVNLAIADGRKLSRRQTHADSEHIEQFADQNADQFSKLERERSAQAVRNLLEEMDNDRDKTILQRYYIDELDKQQICEELALTHRHFDKVISRARTRFRQLIESRGLDYLSDAVQESSGHA